jgi:hypothetical protein
MLSVAGPFHTINLSKFVLASAVLDLLVKAYAEEVARARDVAQGFIGEMSKRVAGDVDLDFEGKQQAVRNAIEFYETRIAAGLTQSNFGDIVDAALARAKAQVDEGQSGLARATLRRAAEDLQREERERRSQRASAARFPLSRARLPHAGIGGPSC